MDFDNEFELDIEPGEPHEPIDDGVETPLNLIPPDEESDEPELTKWGDYNPALGQVILRPDLDFEGHPYEPGVNVIYRRLPTVMSVCIAVPPGKRCDIEQMRQLEAEYKSQQ